jgi:hypothetical protein
MHTLCALGAFAMGSAFWGALSDLASLSFALTVAAICMAVGPLLARRFPLRMGETDQGCQCDFGSIGLSRKHGFTKHSASYSDTVQAAYQLVAKPNFDAVGMACKVKFFIGLDDVAHDPSAVLTRTRRTGASLDDL